MVGFEGVIGRKKEHKKRKKLLRWDKNNRVKKGRDAVCVGFEDVLERK